MNSRTYDQADVDAWNWAHPRGSECIEIADPVTIGTIGVLTKTRSSAWLLASGHAVVSLEGRSGGVSVDRVLFLTPGVAPSRPAPQQDSVAGLQLIAHIPSC